MDFTFYGNRLIGDLKETTFSIREVVEKWFVVVKSAYGVLFSKGNPDDALENAEKFAYVYINAFLFLGIRENECWTYAFAYVNLLFNREHARLFTRVFHDLRTYMIETKMSDWRVEKRKSAEHFEKCGEYDPDPDTDGEEDHYVVVAENFESDSEEAVFGEAYAIVCYQWTKTQFAPGLTYFVEICGKELSSVFGFYRRADHFEYVRDDIPAMWSFFLAGMCDMMSLLNENPGFHSLDDALVEKIILLVVDDMWTIWKGKNDIIHFIKNNKWVPKWVKWKKANYTEGFPFKEKLHW